MMKLTLIGIGRTHPCRSFERQQERRPVRIDKVIKWIESKPIETEMKEELINIAIQYPPAALPQFKNTYSKHVSDIRKRKLG